MKTIFFSLSACFIFLSCDCQKKAQKSTPEKVILQTPKTYSEVVNSTYPTTKPDAGIIRLKEGENIFLQQEQMNITFLQTTEDQRCPMNARCQSAGSATVEIELMTTTSRPRKYQLSVGDFGGDKKNSIEFASYKITLQNLYPSNSTELPYQKLKGKYIIDLKVENL